MALGAWDPVFACSSAKKATRSHITTPVSLFPLSLTGPFILNACEYNTGQDSMNALETNATNLGLEERVVRHNTYENLISTVRSNPSGQLILMLSTPPGAVVDDVIQCLLPHVPADSVLLDFGNEHYQNTERRQQDLASRGIHYLGCGVSGGYQSARSGPSFSPGGDPAALAKVMPMLRDLAAKDGKGQPCVNAIGPGSSGHYFKMIHNGIEQGMMSVLAEVWFVLVRGLGLSSEEVAGVFRSWNTEGPLRDCFLIDIGADIVAQRYGWGDVGVLETVRDKVVQDVEESEGTGIWTCQEAISLHEPAATILAAHLLRCASADASRRAAVAKAASAISDGGDNTLLPKPARIRGVSSVQFINSLRSATYFCFLSCFAQGLNMLQAANRQYCWRIDFRSALQVWRGGCIIRADHVVDVLDGVYEARRGRREKNPGDKGKGGDSGNEEVGPQEEDLFASHEVATELLRNFTAAREVVLRAVEADMIVPALSQSLEHFKYAGSTSLPTQFMEAQLDYFGKHMYDTWDDPPGRPRTGSHHYEWKPATGRLDKS